MRENYTPSLTAVLVHEGGYCDDPKDPGGATNHGITEAVYDDYRESHGLPRQWVKLIADVEVEAIYEKRYWSAIKGDELPTGVDYCTFDFAVDSGVGRASRYLQQVASVTSDGQIGPATLTAVASLSATEVIDALCNARLAFLQRLPTFGRFGKGWTARVEDVRAKARDMAA